MKRSGIKVDWREGTARNPTDGGTIELPDGRKVAMTFKNDLWRLPVYTAGQPRPTILKPGPASASA
eukprot:2734737-Rhodomonas_salina.1